MDGYTPLYMATLLGHKQIAKLLITNGADVNAMDKIGYAAPLHRAARSHKEIAELLITNGADVNAKNKNGDTPIDFAVRGNQTATIDLLRKHGGKTGAELKAEGK